MARLIQLDGKVVEEFSCLDGPLPEYVPPNWNGAHVGFRLVEAFKTLARLPVANGPRFKSGYWPGAPMACVDIVEIQREWRLNPYSESARDAVNEFASKKPKPTTQQVSHMEAANFLAGALSRFAANPVSADVAGGGAESPRSRSARCRTPLAEAGRPCAPAQSRSARSDGRRFMARSGAGVLANALACFDQGIQCRLVINTAMVFEMLSHTV